MVVERRGSQKKERRYSPRQNSSRESQIAGKARPRPIGLAHASDHCCSESRRRRRGLQRAGGVSGAAVGGTASDARAPGELWCLLALPSVIRGWRSSLRRSNAVQQPSHSWSSASFCCLRTPHGPGRQPLLHSCQPQRPRATHSFNRSSTDPTHRLHSPNAAPFTHNSLHRHLLSALYPLRCSMYLTEELFESADADRPYHSPSKQMDSPHHAHQQHSADSLGKRKRNGDEYTTNTV